VIATGIPEFKRGGDRTQTSTTMRLAVRIPPTMTLSQAERTIKEKLDTETPYNCKLSVAVTHHNESWNMRELEPFVKSAIDLAGKDFLRFVLFYGMGAANETSLSKTNLQNCAPARMPWLNTLSRCYEDS
jgi:hypothetical protein